MDPRMIGMAALIREYRHLLQGPDHTVYRIRAYGEQAGHVWYGWLEFVPDESGLPLQTPRETTQPSWETLRYWALGLQPSYFEGAFRRARLILESPGTGSVKASFTPAEAVRLLAIRAAFETGQFADDHPS